MEELEFSGPTATDMSRLGTTVFGSLTVLKYAGKSEGERQYECVCVCGTHVVRTRQQLNIKKLHRCADCAKERVERIVDAKSQEREKRLRRHTVMVCEEVV